MPSRSNAKATVWAGISVSKFFGGETGSEATPAGNSYTNAKNLMNEDASCRPADLQNSSAAVNVRPHLVYNIKPAASPGRGMLTDRSIFRQWGACYSLLWIELV